METTALAQEFKDAMKEWVELKKVITEARKDLKGLSDRERNLKTYIKGYMKSTKIDTCNLRKGKVSLNIKQAKKAINTKTIEDGLMKFFDNDTGRTTAAIESIQDSREVTERETLSLRGIKDSDQE
tara:strand:- start:2344 stop:2721 length:378 start_codon:yes stop_codon:yes gene_type:complete